MKIDHLFFIALAITGSSFVFTCGSKNTAEQKGRSSQAANVSSPQDRYEDETTEEQSSDEESQNKKASKTKKSEPAERDADALRDRLAGSEPPAPAAPPAPAPTAPASPPAPQNPSPPATPPAPSPPPAAFALTSSAFANNGAIPVLYVAKNNGGNQSPPLAWANPPANTASFAIQCVDLDTNPPILHWMISNIPATSKQLPANILAGNNLTAPPEALGANQIRAYRGPNPPNLHRYEFTIYAIKQGETLNLTANSATNKTELEAKSTGRTTLIGTFQ